LTNDKAANGAYYECEVCKAHWSDINKVDALPHGQWRSTAESKDERTASFHLSSLYSPWTTWRGIVSSFLNTKNFPDLLHDFINSELGEPWIPEVVRVNDNAVADRVKPYTRGQTMQTANCFGDQYKDGKTMFALGVDVQKDDLRFIVRQFSGGGDSILIDYGRLHTWQQVASMADALGSNGVPVWVLVDSGYGLRTQEVYEACHKFNFIPTKGASERMRGLTWAQSNINPFEGDKKQAEGMSIPLVTFDTVSIKLQLIDRIQGKGTFQWHVFSGIDDTYAREVTSEEYSPDSGKFQLRRGFKDNHFLDCEVLALLAATIAGFNSTVYSAEKSVDNGA
jgi:phage terminase large subunit GpA-like protein